MQQILHNNKQDVETSTREALIKAALALFGEYGYRGTSTRMLAERSQANISAIPYYFGSKQGLYHAVMEYIVARNQALMGPMFDDIVARSEQKNLSKKMAQALFLEVMDAFMDVFIQSEEPKAWAQLVMREQANPTEAFDIIYDGHIGQMQRLLSKLMGIILSMPATHAEVVLRVNALFGQILIFVVAHESTMRHLNAKTMSKKHRALLRDILHAHFQSAIHIGKIGV